MGKLQRKSRWMSGPVECKWTLFHHFIKDASSNKKCIASSITNPSFLSPGVAGGQEEVWMPLGKGLQQGILHVGQARTQRRTAENPGRRRPVRRPRNGMIWGLWRNPTPYTTCYVHLAAKCWCFPLITWRALYAIVNIMFLLIVVGYSNGLGPYDM